MKIPDQDQLDFAASIDTLTGRADPLGSLRTAPGPRTLDRTLWDELVGIGVLDPLADGDIGTACVVAEMLGRHCTPVPFLPASLAGVLARGAGHDGELPGITSIGMLGADGAFSGPVLGHPDGGSVHGRLPFVPDGDVADGVLAVAAGPTLVHVDLTGPAVTRTPLESIAPTVPFAAVDLEGAPVTVLSDDPAAVARALDRTRLTGLALVAADLTGAASRLLDMAVEYAGQRVQFGQAIGSRQAIKHMCARMLTAVESSRAAVLAVAGALGPDGPASGTGRSGDPIVEVELTASAVKAWVSDAATECAGGSLQIHGGVGFTWEHDLHHFFKRCTVGSILLGTAAHHRDRIAGLLAHEPA